MKNTKNIARIAPLLLALLLGACAGETPEALLESAKAQLAAKDSKAAVIQLKNALQKNPSLAEARFLLGKLLLDGGDPVGALVELGKAEELGFSAEQLAPTMARALLAQQAFDKVVAKFAEAKLSTPAAIADTQVAVGTAYAALGNFEAAAKAAKLALAAQAHHDDAELLLVRISASKGEFDEAFFRLDEALKRNPGNAKAWVLKGELLSRNPAQLDQAKAALREAIQRDPSHIGAYVGLVPMLMQARDFDGAKTEIERLRKIAPGAYHTIYFSGWHALETGDLEQANEQAQRLLKVLPDKPDVLYLAGATQARRNSLTQAEDLLAKALSIEPKMVNVRVLLAQTQLRRGDAAKGLATLQPLLSADPPLLPALMLAADGHLMLGESAKAEELFAKVAKLDPSNVASRIAVANAKMGRGQTEEGLAALREIAKTDTGNSASLAIANELWRRKRYDEALKALADLDAKSPKQAFVQMLRGNIELSRGKRDVARQAYEDAVKLDPKFFPAVARLADIEVQDGHEDAALKRLNDFIAAQPKHAGARMMLVRMRAQAGANSDELLPMLNTAIKEAPTEKEPRLALIRLYLGKPDNKLALSAAQAAAAALPDDPEVMQMLGQALLASGDKNQAISTFGKMISEHPKFPHAYLLLADAYAKSKDDAAAMQTIRRAISAVPQYMPSYQALTALEMGAGRSKAALEVAKAAQKQQPDDSTGYMLEGDIALSAKDLGAAAAAYKLGLSRSEAPGLAIRLHRTLLAQSKRDEAQTLERQRLEKFPADIAFLTYLGDLSIVEGRLDVAEKRYARLIELQPNNGPALNNLAWVLSKQGKPGALDLAERANKAVPNRPEFIDTMAEISAANGKLKEAIELQRRAVSLAPDYQVHRLHLARYLVRDGQKQEARSELERLDKLGNKFAGHEEVKKLLQSL